MLRPINKLLIISTIAVFISANRPAPSEDERLQQMLRQFIAGSESLNRPGRTLSYVDNLRNIQDLAGIDQQIQFFKTASAQANTVDEGKLSAQNRLYYRQWRYELAMNESRTTLEKKYKLTQPNITNQGLFHQALGKEWYLYFLKEYLSLDMSPEELKAFGMKEVRKVQQQIRKVRQKLGFGQDTAAFYAYLQKDRFLLTDEPTILKTYEQKYKTVRQHLSKLFITTDVPPFSFAKIANADENSPPGIYSSASQTFYFNFYEQRHNTRSMDFLLIHEAVPGHHYQSGISRENTARNPFNRIFYVSFSEGWAAYCEEFGHELGLYQTPEDYYGKREWDLVRSARVVMDVGLNYEGWSKEQALAFWKQHIPHQDGIAMREINRMLRWPLQVHSYKVGADVFLNLQQKSRQQLGNQFDIRQFHEQLLRQGPVPLAVLMAQKNS